MTLMTLSVFLLVALLLLQTLQVGLTAYHLRRQMNLLETTLERLAEKSVRGLGLANGALAALERYAAELPGLEEAAGERLDRYAKKAGEADELLARKVDLLRDRARESEGALESLLDDISEQVYTLQRVALYPSLQVATLVKSGLGLLKRTALPEARSAAVPSPDSEDFI